MSLLARKEIEIKGLKVELSETELKLSNGKENLLVPILPRVEIIQNESTLKVNPVKGFEKKNANLGTVTKLLLNAVEGLTNKFVKKLRLVGTGYRAKKISDSKIELILGYSHPVVFELPKEVTYSIESNTLIVLQSIDKQKLGQVSANIRAKRPPNVYKGKGVLYDGEVISLKDINKK